MKIKLFGAGIAVSLLLHLVIFLALGRININFSAFEVIEAYLFQNKKNMQKINIEKKTETEKKTEKEEKQYSKSSDHMKINDIDQSNSLEEEFSDEIVEVAYSKGSYNNIFNNFINEKMKFDIYWMGLYVGSASVSVDGDQNNILITSTVNSSEFISNFYYVNDKAMCKIIDGKPRHFKLLQIEGKYRGNKETFFDYEKGEITFINHIKNKVTYHKGINKLFMDVLSGFFYLRSMPIKLNKTLTIDIFDSDKFLTVQVHVLREEVIELQSKRQIETIVIKPQLETEGIFKRKGDIFIWLSKDERKIPLRIETKIPIGKVVAELREYRQ